MDFLKWVVVVAQPRVPRATRLQPPHELVVTPVLTQHLRRECYHPRVSHRLHPAAPASGTVILPFESPVPDRVRQ
jgi:hypothetical protein